MENKKKKHRVRDRMQSSEDQKNNQIKIKNQGKSRRDPERMKQEYAATPEHVGRKENESGRNQRCGGL